MASLRLHASWRRHWEAPIDRRDAQRTARRLVPFPSRQRAQRDWSLHSRRQRILANVTNPAPKFHSDNAPDAAEEDSIVTQDVSKSETDMAEIEGREQSPADRSMWARIKGWFRVDKSRLQNLGIGAFLAYGFVSNVNYGVFFTIAWLSHVKRTGMIPFAPGQWPAFLGVYAGLWAIQNFLRPFRIAAAIALTPLVNQMLQYLVERLGIQRRQAFLLLLFGLAVFTFSSLVTGIWILGGIPARPPKPV